MCVEAVRTERVLDAATERIQRSSSPGGALVAGDTLGGDSGLRALDEVDMNCVDAREPSKIHWQVETRPGRGGERAQQAALGRADGIVAALYMSWMMMTAHTRRLGERQARSARAVHLLSFSDCDLCDLWRRWRRRRCWQVLAHAAIAETPLPLPPRCLFFSLPVSSAYTICISASISLLAPHSSSLAPPSPAPCST